MFVCCSSIESSRKVSLPNLCPLVLDAVITPDAVTVPTLDIFLPPEITSVPPICSPSFARLSFPSAAKVKYLYAPLAHVRIVKAFVADSYK